MKTKLTLFFCLLSLGMFAQELSCKVKINSQQIQTTERAVFDDMERSLEDFMNDREWTEDRFQNQEKIKCVIQITLSSSPEIGRYKGSFQIIAVRPVYNSTYESMLINYIDNNIDFRYLESQQLNFNEASFTDNLTSLLAYYGYLILAYDYDSFALNGGDEYFRVAQQITSAAQNQGYGGWDQFGKMKENIRYWWVDDARSQTLSSFREAVYLYHRKGLDLMHEGEETARENMLEAIKKLQETNKSKPRSVLVMSFLNAKKDEMVDVFSKGDMAMRRQALDILKELDPINLSDYQEILSN